MAGTVMVGIGAQGPHLANELHSSQRGESERAHEEEILYYLRHHFRVTQPIRWQINCNAMDRLCHLSRYLGLIFGRTVTLCRNLVIGYSFGSRDGCDADYFVVRRCFLRGCESRL